MSYLDRVDGLAGVISVQTREYFLDEIPDDILSGLYHVESSHNR